MIVNTSRMSMSNHVRECVGDRYEVTSMDAGFVPSEDAVCVPSENEGSVPDPDELLYTSDDSQDLAPGMMGVENEPLLPRVIQGLDDFDHLTQFLDTGRCPCTDAELQLIKFVHMAHGGYGVSRAFTEGMLQYCKEAGGANCILPDTWRRCVEDTTLLIERLEGKRKTFFLDVPIPDDVRLLLADPTQATIAFEFECPITEMIRIAMFSKTCQSMDNVAFTYEDDDGHLDDFCNGDRYKRIADNMSVGSAILGCVLATDGICLDKCMFDSQEVHTPIPNHTPHTGFFFTVHSKRVFSTTEHSRAQSAKNTRTHKDGVGSFDSTLVSLGIFCFLYP
jgi:hypothetical protein